MATSYMMVGRRASDVWLRADTQMYAMARGRRAEDGRLYPLGYGATKLPQANVDVFERQLSMTEAERVQLPTTSHPKILGSLDAKTNGIDGSRP
jgi:hypothetical protein